MAIVPALSLTRQSLTRGGLLVLPLIAALAAGCVVTDDMLLWKSEKKPTEPVCQLLCMWQNSVQFAADPTRNGNPGPGLAARLYLFGKVPGCPLRGDGKLVVDLIDETDGKPIHKEQWRIDPETLQLLQSKDFVGTGYTLFLPWIGYRPETSKVRLRVGFFATTKAAPLFTENVITLAEGNGVIREHSGPMPAKPSAPGGPLNVNPGLPARPPMLPPPTANK